MSKQKHVDLINFYRILTLTDLKMEIVLPNFSNQTDLTLLSGDQVLNKLTDLTKYCQDGENRLMLNTSNFKLVASLLKIILDGDNPRDDILVEAFRFLRNSVVACERNQDCVREESDLYEVTKYFLQSACGENLKETALEAEQIGHGAQSKCSEDRLVAIRCSLQFLANSMVDNQKNVKEVVSRFMDDFTKLVICFHTDEKIIQYVAMNVHLALKNCPERYAVSSEMLYCFLQNLHLEFVIYVMESVLLMENLDEMYEVMEPESRIKLLSFLNSRLDLLKSLNVKTVSAIKSNFIQRSDFILRCKIDDRDNIFCWEIAVLLEAICSISLTENSTLKNDEVVITTVLYLLKQIYETGKVKGTVFSPDEDLGKLTTKSSTRDNADDIRAHPTFQFKANLIRLIGSLVHRNKANQDKVRELECLPIVLDSCKIDARNPFIAQWSVLTIRNLCEGNEENQAYIQEVQRVDTENLLPNLAMVDLSN